MAWLPKISTAAAGMATSRPIVATTLIMGEDEAQVLEEHGVEEHPECR